MAFCHWNNNVSSYTLQPIVHQDPKYQALKQPSMSDQLCAHQHDLLNNNSVLVTKNYHSVRNK